MAFRSLLLGLSLIFCGTVSADFIIDFEDLQSSGTGSVDHAGTYSIGGYRLVSDPPFGSPPRFSTYQTGSPRFPGSTALREFFASAITTLEREDGAAFSLLSIALAELNSAHAGTVKTIEFRGTRSDTSNVTQTFNLGSVTAGVFDLETFFFSSDFDDVVSVEWTQGVGATGTAFQFDNITVSPIPEPGFGLGLFFVLLIIGGAARRAKRTVPSPGIVAC